ncbi:VOC family protein [Candidatus Woesearchaeota archaeon]|nr:MAG: VOC family protein [Candidatus Woesearchaeota archaeon]
MPNPICHVEIPVSDLNVAKEFYEKVFGWNVHITQDMTYAMGETGHATTVGFRLDVSTPDDTTIVPFIEVEDMDGILDKIRENGGSLSKGPEEIKGTGTRAEFKDPFDNIVGLWKVKRE